MGRLATLSELTQGLGADWYFTEFENGQPVLPSDEFKHDVAINNDTFKQHHGLKNIIRKFVTENVTDLVLVDEVTEDYFHYWSTRGPRYDWDGGHIHWGFHIFYFQEENEAVLFKLRFSEYIAELTPYDPERPPSHIQEAEYRKKEAEQNLATAQERLSKAQVAYKKALANKKNEEWDEFIEECFELEEDDLKKLADQFDWEDFDEDGNIFFVNQDSGATFKSPTLSNAIKWKKRVMRETKDLEEHLKDPFSRRRRLY